MIDLEQPSPESAPTLLASNVGDYVLDGARICSPDYLQEEASRILDPQQRDLRLGQIAIAPEVIVWRVNSNVINLGDEQTARLRAISYGNSKATRVIQFFTSDRTEARRTADLIRQLDVPSQAGAVIVGICTEFLQIDYDTPAPNQARLEDHELDWCRSIGLGGNYATLGSSLGITSQQFNSKFKKVYDKVPAPELTALMRRLFEIGIFQPYRQGQIFGDSEITRA